MDIDQQRNKGLKKALDWQQQCRDKSSSNTDKPGNMFRKLGTLASAIYKDEKKLTETAPTPNTVRVYTFKHTAELAIIPAVLTTSDPKNVDATVETLTFPFEITLPALSNPEFKSSETTWVVGYDIETQSYKDGGGYIEETDEYTKRTPSHCVSHQWYFNFQGVRYGLIFLTELRITQDEFVEFMKGAVPKIENPAILKYVKVYAHFSVMESGWMVQSSSDSSEKGAFQPLIKECNDEWTDKTQLRSYKLSPPAKTPTGRPCKAKPKEQSIYLEFADSMKLQASSLKKLGENIGIDKLELDDGVIEQMAAYLKTHPKTFCEYAIIDSVITAESHVYFYNKFKICMLGSADANADEHTRMPGYSSAYFKHIYEQHYGDDWKQYLGYDDDGMTLVHKSFVHFYHGGRNDVLSVGPRGEAHYLDLHSAYLTSVFMLDDYNFSKSRVTTGTSAKTLLDELYQDGPFQVIGIECSFQFKDSAKPIFPVRIDEAESLPGVRVNFNSDGIIYPKSGKANITMPEYWVARHHDLIDQIIIHRVVTFEKLPTHWLSDDILRLLKFRKDSNESDKLYYKNILNFFYGKTAQGVKASASALKAHNLEKHVNTSSMTCYPLAAYITGFCRATVGEMLQQNPCYGITTDGFITSVPRRKLKMKVGDLCFQVQKKLRKGGFLHKRFIGTDASGNRSLFLKTRGYVLIDDSQPTPKKKMRKMAAMGIQVDKHKTLDPVQDFLQILQKGYGDKGFFSKLNRIREEQRKNPSKVVVPERRVLENVKADMTFDMKHIPLAPATEQFEWNGVQYPFTSFETQPLETADDFHILRALRKRDHLKDLPKGLLDEEFSYISPEELDSEVMRDAEEYFAQLILEEQAEQQKTAGPSPDGIQQPESSVPQTPSSEKPPKTRTKIFNGVKKEQFLNFNAKRDAKTIIELQRRAKQIPTYMEAVDYKQMLKRFDEFRNGTLPKEIEQAVNVEEDAEVEVKSAPTSDLCDEFIRITDDVLTFDNDFDE